MKAEQFEILSKLADRGKLTPENVLAEARKESSPLHDHFQWDDADAAEKWRLDQASRLIRTFTITVETRAQTTSNVTIEVPAFVNLSHAQGPGPVKGTPYKPRDQVMSSKSMRKAFVLQIIGTISAVLQRNADVTELDPIRKATEAVDRAMRVSKVG